MEQVKRLILIVDDDKNFREIIGLKLKALGFDIIEAENGQDALDKLEKIHSDLVILDMQMPVMDGFKTLDEIKSHSKFNGVKVVFLSNYGEDVEKFQNADKILARDLGAVTHIRKSDDLDKIVAEIEKIIAG